MEDLINTINQTNYKVFNLEKVKKDIINEIPKNCTNRNYIINKINNITNNSIRVGGVKDYNLEKKYEDYKKQLIKIIRQIETDNYIIFKNNVKKYIKYIIYIIKLLKK
jgi:hypothetical protein